MNNNSSQFYDQSSFLWNVLHLYFVKHSIDEMIHLISSMYEQKFDFSSDIERMLLTLWKTRDASYVYEIAKEVVSLKLLDIEKHIFIVAALLEHKKISIADAAQLLIIDEPRNYAQLDSRVKRVIDVAWLITEDSKENVMSPSDDSLLEDALRGVTTLYITAR